MLGFTKLKKKAELYGMPMPKVGDFNAAHLHDEAVAIWAMNVQEEYELRGTRYEHPYEFLLDQIEQKIANAPKLSDDDLDAFDKVANLLLTMCEDEGINYQEEPDMIDYTGQNV